MGTKDGTCISDYRSDEGGSYDYENESGVVLGIRVMLLRLWLGEWLFLGDMVD